MEKSKFNVTIVTLIFSTVFLLAGCGNVGTNSKGSSASKYGVTYNGNGNTSGSVPSDATAYQKGETVTVLGNTGSLVKTGYSFNGWNTLTSGYGTTYTVGENFTMGTANVTLYAQWTASASGYTMTYNGNGGAGSVPVDSNRYYVGQTVTMPGNSGLTYTGYSFVGWQTKADGSGTTYAAGKTFTMGSANVTLYALWAGGYAYAVNHNDGSEGTISQYTIGPNGALTPMFTPTVPTGGNDTRNIAVDPLGKYIYVSNPTSETVSQFTIGADGSLTSMSTPTILVGPLAGGQLYYPGTIAVHPSGPWAYVLNTQTFDINQYMIGANGSLTSMTTPTVVAGSGESYPQSITVHPSGKWAYVPNDNGGYGGSISQYNIDQMTGALTSASPPTVAAGPAYSHPYDITIEPTKGKYAYVADYGDGNILQYNINQTTGALTPMSTPTVTIPMGGTMSISITVDPSGRFVYATIGTNPSTPTAVIAQFTIDQNTGALIAMTPPTVSAGGAGTAVITVEASGKYAYATSGESGWGSSSIAQFTIDQTTGALTLMNNPTVQTLGIGPSGIVTVGK